LLFFEARRRRRRETAKKKPEKAAAAVETNKWILREGVKFQFRFEYTNLQGIKKRRARER
jgi:hypothetical protein